MRFWTPQLVVGRHEQAYASQLHNCSIAAAEVLFDELTAAFHGLPPGKLAEFRRQAVERGCPLVEKYLRGGYRAIA